MITFVMFLLEKTSKTASPHSKGAEDSMKKQKMCFILSVKPFVWTAYFRVPSMGSNLAVKVRYTDGSRKC